MSRENLSGSTVSLSHSMYQSGSTKGTQSRTPVKAKRSVLGERVDNYDHPTPRQHLVKTVKSVIRPRLSATKINTTASSRAISYQPSPTRASTHASSPRSFASSPAGANVSRPGHTPHPRRSSVALGHRISNDATMLFDTSRPDFFVDDTDESEADEEPETGTMVRRAVMGPGRLMTPANSQESQNQPNSQERALKEPSPRRLAMRLPTPPASQPGTDVDDSLSRTLVRPRPAPTPPRRSATPSLRLNGSTAQLAQEISPNPRRKKSPRVDEAGQSRLRSPFELAVPSNSIASPPHPRDRVEVVISRPRTSTPKTTPKATKGPRKSRPSTKTPSASHPLSQSTSSQPSRVRRAPATAPPANRRKSTPAATRQRPSPPRTSVAKSKFAKAPRLSVPGRSRKSVTPAELKAMIGLLPEPVEQGSPSDDPLLLVGEEEEHFRKTPAIRPSSRAGTSKSTGKSTARIIDFDAAIAQDSARSNMQERTLDYEVPLQGSEAEYDGPQDYGLDSGGDSDNEDIGNDTFLHVASAGSRPTSATSLMDRLNERQTDSTNVSSPSRSRTPSPFLPATLMAREEQVASPNASIQSRGDAINTSSQQAPSPVGAAILSPAGHNIESSFLPTSLDVGERGASLAPSAYSTGTPNDMTDYRAASPRSVADAVGSSPAPSVTVAGWPSPAASLRSMASPQIKRSQSATPMAQDLNSRSSPVRFSSPSQVEMEHWNHPVSSSPMGSPTFARSMTSTPRAHLTMLGEAEDKAASVADLPGRSSIGTLSAASSPKPTRSRTATPAAKLEYSPGSAAQNPRSETRTASPYPRASALEEEVVEEQVQDSWSAGSPLLLPGTPSALGLFMPEEADGMSTPHSQAPVGEDQTPKPAMAASPAQSRLTPASIARDMPIIGTQSPRRSPVVLPEVVEEDVEPTQESEDKENLAPAPQSTTPVMSPPTLQASTPPFYAFNFSPRIASPLRITHIQAPSPSPKKLEKFTLFASRSPIPPIESLHERFADEEVDDCPSGDVTLEGNSADWSLSDEELAHNAGMEEALVQDEDSAEDMLDLETETEGKEGPVLDAPKASEFEGQEDVAVGGVILESVHGAEPSQVTEEVIGEKTQEEQEEVAIDDCEPDAIEEVEENGQEQDDDHLPAPTIAEASEQTKRLATPIPVVGGERPEKSSDEEEEEEDSVPAEEGSSSDTLADDAGLQSDTVLDESFGEGVEAEESASPAPPPAAAPAPMPEKIILKLINRGIVKLEPEDDYVAPQQSTLAPVTLTTSEETRSTTPAYEPPQSITTAVSATAVSRPSPAPVSISTLYPDLPATPVFAPLSPLPSSTPLDSPPIRQQNLQSSQNIKSFENTFGGHAGPSTRPRSHLSRQIPNSPEEDEADSSIRVRAVQSLGDEMDDADNSMRSVVEVSSFDPKAAARAAAILKLNHAYIEHGDISKLGESAHSTSTRRRSMHSARLDQMDASRRNDKTELLYEAELEIVSTRRSRSRSMSRFRAVSEATTELPLPGAWNGTPQIKRKRTALAEHYVEPPKTTPTWGVSQWKKLEKVFRAEREIWVTEREVKAMPGGFIGWARMSTFGPPAPTSKPWDPTRVVDRFLEEQTVSLAEQVGDWSRELLFTRVEALERHAEHRKMKDQAPAPGPSPKKAKTNTPAKASRPPPSTVRKLFGWVLPGSSPKVSTTIASIASKKALEPKSEKDGKLKEWATEGGETFLNRLEAIQAQSPPRQMTQVLTDSVTRRHSNAQLDLAPQHPSSPAWKNAPVPPPASRCRPTPRTLSAILAESSSSTSSGVNTSTNRLHSSLSQRSAALDALFSGSTSTATKPAIGPLIKRSSSVKDMVRSFEDSGAFENVLNKGEKKV